MDMNIKQKIFHNILVAFFMSFAVGFFMVWIAGGTPPTSQLFLEEYMHTAWYGLVITLPLIFIASPILHKITHALIK